eukprot:3267058-Amphidinium_carterae.1
MYNPTPPRQAPKHSRAPMSATPMANCKGCRLASSLPTLAHLRHALNTFANVKTLVRKQYCEVLAVSSWKERHVCQVDGPNAQTTRWIN